jgi:hypothetical protein
MKPRRLEITVKVIRAETGSQPAELEAFSESLAQGMKKLRDLVGPLRRGSWLGARL